jgi:hypothetical protein
MADKITYKDMGFDKFLTRNSPHSKVDTEFETSGRITQLSGEVIASGKSVSANKKMTIDWDRGEITLSDLARNRIIFGNIQGTGIYGIRIIDATGNTRFESSNDRQFMDIAGKQVSVSTEETGDFTDIQEAIDYINGLGGGTVFIKSGTYIPTSDMTLYSNITLLGEDSTNTIINFNSSSYRLVVEGTAFTTGGLVRNVRISNLQFKNCYNPTYGAIYLHWVTDSIIENCKFLSNWNASAGYGADIYKTGCQRIRITNCQTSLSGHFVKGVPIANTDYHIEISNCFASTMKDDVIVNPGSTNTRIFNNIINFSEGAGISLTSPSPIHAKISNNYIAYTTGNGIYANVSNLLISGNEIKSYSSSDNLIVIEGAGGEDAQIVSNMLNGVPENKVGIVIGQNRDGSIITSNIIRALSGVGGQNGVTIATGADDTVVVANQFDVAGTDVVDNGTASVIANNASA